MNSDDELPAGWLTQFRRGLLSGAGLLLLAVGLCAVPAFAAWLVPGADTTPASTVVKAGALLALSAPHGGLVLDATAVSLSPLLVTLALGWLVAGQARRSESWSSVVGLAVGYGAASGLVARWARLGATGAPALRSLIAAMLFVAVIGGLARALDRGWPRLSEGSRRVVRAAGVATGCYLLAGALLSAVTLAVHLQDAVALQRQLAPGAAGLPVALLGVAAAPNAVLAAVGYLTGPGFQIGSHTSVSVLAVSHGRLPTFPLLAGVPHGRPTILLGVLAIVAVALLAGWAMLRMLAGDGRARRPSETAAAALLTGLSLALLAGLGSGSVGHGALRGIGTPWWAVGAASTVLLLCASGVLLAVEALRGRPAALPIGRVYPLRPAAEAKPAATAEQRSSEQRPVEAADRPRNVG